MKRVETSLLGDGHTGDARGAGQGNADARPAAAGHGERRAAGPAEQAVRDRGIDAHETHETHEMPETQKTPDATHAVQAAQIDAATALANHVRVGRRLKALRKERGMSLTELALKAGVSASMLSQTERGLTNPSIKIIHRVREALDVPLIALLEDGVVESGARPDRAAGTVRPPLAIPGEPGPTDDFVRRAYDRPFFEGSDHMLRKELLSPHGTHDLEFMIIVLQPDYVSEDVLIGPGEKAGIVLEGEMVLEVDGARTTLFAGDSFQFKSTLRHSVRNESSQPVRMLWIMNTKPSAIRF